MGDQPADVSELDQLVSPESAAEIRKNLSEKEPDPDCLVLPENWPAAQLFWKSAGSCWQYATMTGRVLGMRYEAVDIVIRRGGFESEFSPDDWDRFQIIEQTARAEMNRIADQKT